MNDVEAEVMFTNMSHDPIDFPMSKGFAGPMYTTRVRVTSNDGNLIQLTPIAKKLYGLSSEPLGITSGDFGGRILPGKTATRVFYISMYYNFLRPGSYSATISEPDPKKAECVIRSNVTRFQVSD